MGSPIINVVFFKFNKLYWLLNKVKFCIRKTTLLVGTPNNYYKNDKSSLESKTARWDRLDRLESCFKRLSRLFAGGMFALGAKTFENELSERYMTIAAGLTNTCHESYDRSYTKLGPEAFHFIEGNEAKSLKNGEKYYILRPEVSTVYTNLEQRSCSSKIDIFFFLFKVDRFKCQEDFILFQSTLSRSLNIMNGVHVLCNWI